MPRILCLWLPNWPIQRLIRIRPELSGRALVLEAPAVRGSRVVACCRAAMAQGVRVDMPLAEAKSLVRDVAIEPHDPTADAEELRRLAAACEQFSPCVALEEGDEPESLLLDITNLAHLLGSEAELAGKVERFFAAERYRVQMAVADTVGLAWGVAHYGVKTDAGCSMLDAGWNNDDPASSNQYLASSSLPVEALRIAPDVVELLHQLGIETVGQLLPLAREDLAARFGEPLLRRVDQMTGNAPEVLVPHRAPAALEVGCSLEHATGDRAVLTHVLAQLVEQLARQLAVRDQGAVLLVCALRLAGGTPRAAGEGRGPSEYATPFVRPQGVPPEDDRTVAFRIGLVQPSASAPQLMELVDLHLETVTLADEVAHVEIRAAVVGRLGERQGELFVDRWPTDPHQLAVLVNRLSSRLGYEHVLQPRLGGSPVPERAVRYAPVAGKARAESRGSRAKTQARDSTSEASLPPRPLLLYPEPQPIEVTAVVPEGPPQFVWIGGRREAITAHWGPERIETLWWRGPTVRRDYYRVATATGSQQWIFQQLADGKWFLHGLFV